MKIAIMQPYLFPYIGYFQLICSADKFVLYNDVTYIKQGWINRNNFLQNGAAKLVTFPVKNASSNKLIKDIEFNITDKEIKKFKKFLGQQYSKAINFNEVMILIDKIFKFENLYIDKFIYNSILEILRYLEIELEIILSSDIEKNNELKAANKVIEICKKLGGDEYINSIGGIELYSQEEFEKYNIKLNFLKTNQINYPQLNNEFVGNLSIIDILMFNSKVEVRKLLQAYSFV